MIRSIILLIAMIFVIAPNNAGAQTSDYSVIAKSDKENITIYAKRLEGLYYDFKIDFKGTRFSRPFWMNVTNPSYAPQVFYEYINKDEKRELIIILTKGYGTGALIEEVYVYKNTNGLIDLLIDNPLAIIHKNVKTKLTTEKGEVRINDKVYKVDITPITIKPKLGDEISFGSIIDYELRDNELIAIIPGQITPAAYIGEIVIVYEYQDKMFQAKSIEFQPANL